MAEKKEILLKLLRISDAAMFLLLLVAFIYAAALTFLNPAKAIVPEYVGLFGSYTYSTFFAFLLTGVVAALIWRDGIRCVQLAFDDLSSFARHFSGISYEEFEGG